jgi:hypothetical protein
MSPHHLADARTGRCLFILLMALALVPTACHKNKPAASAAQQNQPVASAGEPQPLVGEVHAEMTAQLHIFEQLAGRLPTNFTELARTRLDLVPRHPPGMQWAIDPATHEVKLVKQ